MSRRVRPPGQRPARESPRCSWDHSFTSQVIVFHTRTLARAASRSVAASSASSSLPANEVRLIQRRSGQRRARPLISSMFCRFCARGGASCFTVGTVGTDPVASRLRSSSCWLARLLAGSSPRAKKTALSRAGTDQRPVRRTTDEGHWRWERHDPSWGRLTCMPHEALDACRRGGGKRG